MTSTILDVRKIGSLFRPSRPALVEFRYRLHWRSPQRSKGADRMHRPTPSRFIAALPLAWLAACGGPLIPKMYTPPEAATVDDEIALVERLRYARRTAPVPIHELDDASFEAAIQERRKNENAESRAHAEAFASAFTFGIEGDDPYAAMGHAIQRSSLGFYSAAERAIFVRKRRGTASELHTLAHEVEHALQDARFDLRRLSRPHLDAFCAALAVVEGDATLTAELVSARAGGSSPELALTLASHAEDTRTFQKPRTETAAVVTTWLDWPYRRGTAFTADLVRAGGWALVDAALREPPATTEQVIHLEKYLAGEPAIPVRAPTPPAGWHAQTDGTLGELTTSAFLAECVPDADARAAATGWGGDAYLVATKGGSSALLWITAWDDEASASRFHRALDARRACARTGAKPPHVSAISGTRVAFVQGIDGADSIAKEMFSLVGDAPPASPPAPGVKAPARAKLPGDFAGHARVTQGRWVDSDIGLESDVTGLQIANDTRFNLLAKAPGVMVFVGTHWGATSPEAEERLVGKIVESFRGRSRPDERSAWDEGRESVSLGWTTARARQVTFVDGTEIRVLFAPACDGKATYVLGAASTGWGPPAMMAERWLKSIRAPGEDTAPLCNAISVLRWPERP